MPSQQVFSAKDGATYTASNGAPVSEPYAAQRVGQVGPLLLQGSYNKFSVLSLILIFRTPDFHHIDLLAHFDRERIPERVVSLTCAPHRVASSQLLSRSTPKAQVPTVTSK